VNIGRSTEFGNPFDVVHNTATAAVNGFKRWINGKGASVQDIATKDRLLPVPDWKNASLPEHTQLVNGVLNIYQAGLAAGSVTLYCPAHTCQKLPGGCHGQVMAKLLHHMFTEAENLQPPPAPPPYAPPHISDPADEEEAPDFFSPSKAAPQHEAEPLSAYITIHIPGLSSSAPARGLQLGAPGGLPELPPRPLHPQQLRFPPPGRGRSLLFQLVGQPVQPSHEVFGIGHGPSAHLCLCSRACPYCYYWLFDPREWNRLCHAMHGNSPAAAAAAPARPVNRRCRPIPRDTTVKAPAPSCPDGHSKGARLLGGSGSSKPSIYKYRCYECDKFLPKLRPKISIPPSLMARPGSRRS